MQYSPSEMAWRLRYVREAAEQNTGQRVEGIQRWCGGARGQSWCCYFATLVLDICFQGDAPIPRCGVCEDVYQLAKARGWVTNTPALDDLFLYVDEHDHAHHIGIVSSVDPLTGIAGNTSSDGTSSNGNGVYRHPIAAHVFVHYPRA